MACTEWEVSGLLYVSGELPAQSRGVFESHVSQCAECDAELNAYTTGRGKWFGPDMLGEQPGARVDAEILRVCCGPRVRYAGASFISILLARPVAVLLFLALGIGTGTYVAYHMDAARAAVAASQPIDDEATTVAAVDSVAPEVSGHARSSTAHDSLHSDSLSDTSPFPRGRGASSQGVIPVELTR